MRREFYAWVDQVRDAVPAFGDDLAQLQQLSRFADRSRDSFYDFLWFLPERP